MSYDFSTFLREGSVQVLHKHGRGVKIRAAWGSEGKIYMCLHKIQLASWKGDLEKEMSLKA